uniref:Uncharacterized protein n=1 Tax=Setaria digitata TaxID=48799 RepID=A0A915PP26_9BILA
MITAAAAPTSAMPAAVDAAPNLVIAEERRSGTVKSDQPEPESGRKSDQFMFVDENDKNELQLSNQPTIRDWTDVVQKSKTVIDNSGYNKTDDESSNKSVKLTSSETPTFDFTKIETLFLNSTTTSSTDKRESEKPDIKDNTDVKIQQEEVIWGAMMMMMMMMIWRSDSDNDCDDDSDDDGECDSVIVYAGNDGIVDFRRAKNECNL